MPVPHCHNFPGRAWRSALANAILLALTVAPPGSAAAAPPKAAAWNEDAARHLLSRACFGGTPEQARKLAVLPIEQAVDQLLDSAGSESAGALDRPEWVREVWVNTLRRYTDMPREEYLVTFRRTSTRNDEELADLKARWLRRMIETAFWCSAQTPPVTSPRPTMPAG